MVARLRHFSDTEVRKKEEGGGEASIVVINRERRGFRGRDREEIGSIIFR